MSSNLTVLLLLALAGFLLGGAITLWKTTRWMAVSLGVCAVLAGVGAFVWGQ
ncbi:hypothetical protein [Nocardia asteroides]|uniref:hypothetical protein n=1 Tax=Nocardia asteroides TaxID=1824 RepID=UPI001E418ACB|nr:hypothetical protein [Nocardia asteroides]UGT64806.1 hypothetical protein LTT61_16635 [Nocardia asteroides]